MVEILFALACVIVIMGFGSGYLTSASQRTNKEATQNELQMFASGISDAFYDLGVPSIDPADSDALTQFEKYLKNLQEEYLSVMFDFSTLTATAGGFTVQIAQPVDIYQTPYTCWFTTKDDYQKYVMIASSGPDGESNHAGYASGAYGDDILVICRPKG